MTTQTNVSTDALTGLDDELSQFVSIKTSDNQVVQVERACALKCEMIRAMMELDINATEFTLGCVDSGVLNAIMKFLKFRETKPYVDIPKPLPYKDYLRVYVPADVMELFNVPDTVLFDMIMAANYLGNTEFLNLACAKLASILMGMSKEEIRERFGVEDDGKNDGEDKDDNDEEKTNT
jgi:S-phase kinase-associated protein 1